MPTRRKSKNPPKLPPRLDELAVPGKNGKNRWLKPGMVVKIVGSRGEFKIKYISEDGTLTAWGGTKNRQRMRSVRADQLKQVVRNTRERAEKLDEAVEG